MPFLNVVLEAYFFKFLYMKRFFYPRYELNCKICETLGGKKNVPHLELISQTTKASPSPCPCFNRRTIRVLVYPQDSNDLSKTLWSRSSNPGPSLLNKAPHISQVCQAIVVCPLHRYCHITILKIPVLWSFLHNSLVSFQIISPNNFFLPVCQENTALKKTS